MLYIVPSRGRPHNVRDLIESWAATRAWAELLICLDVDDPQLPAYEDVLLDRPLWVSVASGPRLRLVGTLNHHANKAAFAYDYEAIGFMGDDHRPRTQGWDTQLLNEIRHCPGTGIAYGNDLLQGANLPTAVLLDTRIVRQLGYMAPPGLVHLYVDNFWRDLGTALGCLRYRADVVIEHLHPVAGKAEWDDGYREVNDGVRYADDAAAYAAYKETYFDRDLRMLTGARPVT